MDFSIFQGLRTLSANIAVEMPESEVNSTHYRILFLAALVLFVFTFFSTLSLKLCGSDSAKNTAPSRNIKNHEKLDTKR